MVTGPVPSLDSSFRFAAQQYLSEGYYHNTYLDRDTDNRNELTLRAKWRYQPSDAWDVVSPPCACKSTMATMPVD